MSTKKIVVQLSAYTILEYAETLEVPADITDAELSALVNKRYEAVDGGSYSGENVYWERGACSARDADDDAPSVTGRVERTKQGLVVAEITEDADPATAHHLAHPEAFARWQSQGRDADDLSAVIDDESLVGTPGRVYEPGLYIGRLNDGRWWLMLGRCETLSDDIAPLEAMLFNWACDEGYAETLLAEDA